MGLLCDRARAPTGHVIQRQRLTRTAMRCSPRRANETASERARTQRYVSHFARRESAFLAESKISATSWSVSCAVRQQNYFFFIMISAATAWIRRELAPMLVGICSARFYICSRSGRKSRLELRAHLKKPAGWLADIPFRSSHSDAGAARVRLALFLRARREWREQREQRELRA